MAGKHSGGNGGTMKDPGSWNGRKGGASKEEEQSGKGKADKTEEVPKGTDGSKRG